MIMIIVIIVIIMIFTIYIAPVKEKELSRCFTGAIKNSTKL